jgi:hypothetical protein
MDDRAWLLLTVALLSVYVVGVGGSTAGAIGAREAWRRRKPGPTDLSGGEVVLAAPALPALMRAARTLGWVAFAPALVLGVFANRHYLWVGPVTVVVMVGLNAFYFSAIRGLGETLTLTADGFRLGKRRVRWVHVTELTGAHVGAFRAMRAPEEGEWQDPKANPNVVLYRLNRALVEPRKSLLERWRGLGYYDGMIRNAFGVSTDELLRSMRERRRAALEAQEPALRRLLDGGVSGRRSPEI